MGFSKLNSPGNSLFSGQISCYVAQETLRLLQRSVFSVSALKCQEIKFASHPSSLHLLPGSWQSPQSLTKAQIHCVLRVENVDVLEDAFIHTELSILIVCVWYIIYIHIYCLIWLHTQTHTHISMCMHVCIWMHSGLCRYGGVYSEKPVLSIWPESRCLESAAFTSLSLQK